MKTNRECVALLDPHHRYEPITPQALRAKLASLREETDIATFMIRTTARVRRDCPHEVTTKLTRLNGVIGGNYERAVNNRRIKEGKTPDFVAQARLWGTKLNRQPLVAHVTPEGDQSLSIDLIVMKRLATVYLNGRGEVVSEETIREWLDPERVPTNQGLDDPVIWRSPRLDHIVGVAIDGHHYVVVDEILTTDRPSSACLKEAVKSFVVTIRRAQAWHDRSLPLSSNSLKDGVPRWVLDDFSRVLAETRREVDEVIATVRKIQDKDTSYDHNS